MTLCFLQHCSVSDLFIFDHQLFFVCPPISSVCACVHQEYSPPLLFLGTVVSASVTSTFQLAQQKKQLNDTSLRLSWSVWCVLFWHHSLQCLPYFCFSHVLHKTSSRVAWTSVFQGPFQCWHHFTQMLIRHWHHRRLREILTQYSRPSPKFLGLYCRRCMQLLDNRQHRVFPTPLGGLPPPTLGAKATRCVIVGII